MNRQVFQQLALCSDHTAEQIRHCHGEQVTALTDDDEHTHLQRFIIGWVLRVR